jgi:hypothetical protein
MARQASHHGSRAVMRFEYPRQECAEIEASVQTVAENQRKQQMQLDAVDIATQQNKFIQQPRRERSSRQGFGQIR